MTDTPEKVYRADCALGELTRPEEWQSCDKWLDRNGSPDPTGQVTLSTGAVVNYWGPIWGLGPVP